MHSKEWDLGISPGHVPPGNLHVVCAGNVRLMGTANCRWLRLSQTLPLVTSPVPWDVGWHVPAGYLQLVPW